MSLYEIGRDYGLAIATLLLAAWATFKATVRKEFVTQEELAAVVKALTDEDRANHDAIVAVRHRVDLVEQQLKSMPDYDVVNRLKDAASELNAAVRELRAEFRGLDDKVDGQGVVVRRVEQHLLDLSAKPA